MAALRVAFIGTKSTQLVNRKSSNLATGAGSVHFGLGNAWDHASRLEKMNVEFVGLADLVLAQVKN